MDALQFYIGASFAILDPTLQWESCTVLSNQGLVNDFLDFSDNRFVDLCSVCTFWDMFLCIWAIDNANVTYLGTKSCERSKHYWQFHL